MAKKGEMKERLIDILCFFDAALNTISTFQTDEF